MRITKGVAIYTIWDRRTWWQQVNELQRTELQRIDRQTALLGYFDGSCDYMTVPDDGGWDFGTGDFTIETWTEKEVEQ
jgi:hypothetical protein